MSNDSIKKIVIVVFGVCLVCSLLVSTAAVKLLPRQTYNKQLDKIKNILIAGDLYSEDKDISIIYKEKIESKIVELASGNIVDEKSYDDVLNTKDFDIKSLSNHPEYGTEINSEKDFANIKRRPKYMIVYFIVENDEVQKIILPIYGKGLWSTMYAFVAFDKDLKTIKGITFYEHGETPGLGGEIENPRWNQIWKGKIAFDENNNIKLNVIKGSVDKSKEESKYQVDGLSGATITTRGVDQMMKYWLSDDGYGSFLSKLRKEM